MPKTRIAPLVAPFTPEVERTLTAMMPAGAPPIALFRTFARWEARWADWLNGTGGRNSPPLGEGLAGRRVASPPPLPHPAPDQELMEARP